MIRTPNETLSRVKYVSKEETVDFSHDNEVTNDELSDAWYRRGAATVNF